MVESVTKITLCKLIQVFGNIQQKHTHKHETSTPLKFEQQFTPEQKWGGTGRRSILSYWFNFWRAGLSLPPSDRKFTSPRSRHLVHVHKAPVEASLCLQLFLGDFPRSGQKIGYKKETIDGVFIDTQVSYNCHII